MKQRQIHSIPLSVLCKTSKTIFTLTCLLGPMPPQLSSEAGPPQKQETPAFEPPVGPLRSPHMPPWLSQAKVGGENWAVVSFPRPNPRLGRGQTPDARLKPAALRCGFSSSSILRESAAIMYCTTIMKQLASCLMLILINPPREYTVY